MFVFDLNCRRRRAWASSTGEEGTCDECVARGDDFIGCALNEGEAMCACDGVLGRSVHIVCD